MCAKGFDKIMNNKGTTDNCIALFIRLLTAHQNFNRVFLRTMFLKTVTEITLKVFVLLTSNFKYILRIPVSIVVTRTSTICITLHFLRFF